MYCVYRQRKCSVRSAKVFSEQIYNANGKEWRKKIEFYWKVQPTVPEDNSIMQIQSSIFTFIVRAVCNEYFCAFFCAVADASVFRVDGAI